MKKPKIVKSEFELWARGTPVLYASCFITWGEIKYRLSFWAYAATCAYKVTQGAVTLYYGSSFEDAAAVFKAA